MSSFQGGYTGRTIRVDLDEGTVSIEESPDVARWLGPRGWNALVAWNEVGPGVGPFDPANRIVFSAGPLVGTGAPTSGRMTVSTIMPRGYPAPMWSWASMGGYLGAELKYAGYDSIVVHGRANSPCYLLVEDDHVSIEDAKDLWGQGTFATQRALKSLHSDQHQVAAIGPAGENRVRFATITHRLNNAVGNGGFGGVMGAKNLKAIAVRGTKGVRIADPARFLEAVAYVWNLTKGGLGYLGQIEEGYPAVACTHGCSVRCYTRVTPTEDRYATGAPLNMRSCVDGAWIGGTGRPYRGTHPGGQKLYVPELPGLGPRGADVANLAEDLGLNRWCYQSWGRYFAALRELGIGEVCGEPLDLENPDWWRDWLLKVAHRRGLGDDYAAGLARFYDKHAVGPAHLAEFMESAGSRGHGWHRDGRMMEPHPSPFWEYSALLYAVSTRDVTPSTHGFFFLNLLYGHPESPKAPGDIPRRLLELAERVYGSARAVHPGDEYIEHVVAWHQHRSVIKDSMGVCDWVFPVLRRTFDTEEELLAELRAEEGSLYGDLSAEAVLYRPCTGLDMSIVEMERPIAERIVNLERCVDVRNHARCRQSDEAVIPHYQWPEKTDGTHMSADGRELRRLLDRYYALRGWSKDDGWPTGEKLEELGLGQAADALRALTS